jgi:hypothetical protein
MLQPANARQTPKPTHNASSLDIGLSFIVPSQISLALIIGEQSAEPIRCNASGARARPDRSTDCVAARFDLLLSDSGLHDLCRKRKLWIVGKVK